jgi:hypothetical protein
MAPARLARLIRKLQRSQDYGSLPIIVKSLQVCES